MAADGPVTYHAATITGDRDGSAVSPAALAGDRSEQGGEVGRAIVHTVLEARVDS